MKTFFTILCLIAATAMYAQNQSSIYANIGGTATKYIVDDVQESDMRFDLHGGVMMDNELSEKVKFFTGFQYGNLGDKDFKVRYVNMPFAIGHKIGDNLSIYGGLSIDIFSKVNQQNGFTKGELEETLKVWNASLFFQALYNISDKFVGYAQYYHGLSNTFKDSQSAEFDIKNQVIRVGVGYKLLGN